MTSDSVWVYQLNVDPDIKNQIQQQLNDRDADRNVAPAFTCFSTYQIRLFPRASQRESQCVRRSSYSDTKAAESQRGAVKAVTLTAED